MRIFFEVKLSLKNPASAGFFVLANNENITPSIFCVGRGEDVFLSAVYSL